MHFNDDLIVKVYHGFVYYTINTGIMRRVINYIAGQGTFTHRIMRKNKYLYFTLTLNIGLS